MTLLGKQFPEQLQHRKAPHTSYPLAQSVWSEWTLR